MIKFIYADDSCLVARGRTFQEVETALYRDMGLMVEYLGNWRLQPSASKTVCSVFHLRNASATQELNIQIGGKRIKHESNPVYLGVTLDRSLSFQSHLKKTAAKVATRNNLLSKLAGSS